jgi:hypothetical protein
VVNVLQINYKINAFIDLLFREFLSLQINRNSRNWYYYVIFFLHKRLDFAQCSAFVVFNEEIEYTHAGLEGQAAWVALFLNRRWINSLKCFEIASHTNCLSFWYSRPLLKHFSNCTIARKEGFDAVTRFCAEFPIHLRKSIKSRIASTIKPDLSGFGPVLSVFWLNVWTNPKIGVWWGTSTKTV